MKTLYSLFVAATLCLLTCSCGKPSPAETIASARAAIASGDYELAGKTLDEAAAIVGESKPSASQLCEMAVLYMTVSEHQAEGAATASALQCYEQAVEIDADSVSAYFRTLPPEESQYLFLLSSLSSQ